MTERKTVHRRSTLPAALVAFLLLTACTAPVTETAARPQGGKQSSAATGAMVTLKDPVEGSFTIKMPKGWRNQAYLVRVYELHNVVATSLSPDGKTLLFIGDPRLPYHMVPTPYMNAETFTAPMNPLMKFAEYQTADQFFARYVRGKFGKLPGFRITKTGPNPEVIQQVRESLQRGNVQMQVSAVRIAFDYTDNGKPMHGLVNGATMTNGSVWFPAVSGVSTPGDPVKQNAVLFRVVASHRTDPGWKARQQQQHEQRMARLRQDHANMIASFNASNRRHEMRMKSIQDAGDASMQRWYQNQAKSDATHRNFLNYITDEHTVVDSSGKAYQVDNSHQRYFVHKRDNTYIGTDTHTSLDDLRAKMQINPDDYKEVKIKKP